MSENETMEKPPVPLRWWAFVIRGLAAILFGVFTFVAPVSGMGALVVSWGVYAIVDGVFGLAVAFRLAGLVRGWGWLVVQGLVGIAAGVVTFVWPGITALALLAVIAAWAVVMGLAGIATAIRFRRHLEGEWILVLSGILSVAYGVLLALNPVPGALSVTWMIGSYSIVVGALLVTLGFRLRRWAAMLADAAAAA